MKQHLDNSVFAVCMLPGIEFTITFYNNSFLHYFSLPEEQSSYNEIKKNAPGTLPEIFKEPIIHCVNTGKSVVFRHISLSGSGKIFWLTQVLPLANASSIICISENISNIELYEDDFVKSKILLDRLYEIFPAAIFITDDKGFIIECNAAAQRIFGYSRDEYLKMNVLETQQDTVLVHTDYSILLSHETPVAKALLNKTVVENEVFGISVNNSELMWVNVSSAFLNIPGYGVVCTCRNITSQQSQAQKILESKKILQAIINSSFDTIIFLDTDLKIAWYNTEAEKKIFRLLGNKIQSDEYAEYILNDDPKEKLVSYIKEAREKKVYAYERAVTSAYGEELWYYRRYHPAYNEKGEYIGCVIISTNITERKKKEMHIKSQNDKLKEIARVQSHELRRPLANIMALISLLEEGAEKEVDIDLLAQAAANAKELDKVILKITRRTEPG